MATVVQFGATDAKHKCYEPNTAESGEWHAFVTAGDDPRTICGIQMNGEDGYAPLYEKEGKVSCITCRSLLEAYQAIKNWK